jgi:sorting nexin-4
VGVDPAMDDFADVSWQNDTQRNASKQHDPSSSEDGGPTMGGGMDPTGRSGQSHGAGAGDALDLAGVGDGTIECIVNTPIKENDGTKDVFVSYLVTTHVRTIVQELRISADSL